MPSSNDTRYYAKAELPKAAKEKLAEKNAPKKPEAKVVPAVVEAKVADKK